MEGEDLANINNSEECLVHSSLTCLLWRALPLLQNRFIAVFLLKPSGSMVNISWQGRQRMLISFEVGTIVTSKAGQRMGLDWETFHLDALRVLEASRLQSHPEWGTVCWVSQIEHSTPKQNKKISPAFC